MLVDLKRVGLSYFNWSHLWEVGVTFNITPPVYRLATSNSIRASVDEIFDLLLKICKYLDFQKNIWDRIELNLTYYHSYRSYFITYDNAIPAIKRINKLYGIRFIKIKDNHIMINKYFLYTKSKVDEPWLNDIRRRIEIFRKNTPQISKQLTAVIYSQWLYLRILRYRFAIVHMFHIDIKLSPYTIYDCLCEVINLIQNRIYPYKLRVTDGLNGGAEFYIIR